MAKPKEPEGKTPNLERSDPHLKKGLGWPWDFFGHVTMDGDIFLRRHKHLIGGGEQAVEADGELQVWEVATDQASASQRPPRVDRSAHWDLRRLIQSRDAPGASHGPLLKCERSVHWDLRRLIQSRDSPGATHALPL